MKRLTHNRGTLPPDYREVLYWKLTGNVWRLVGINLLALPLALIAGMVFVPLGLWAAPSVRGIAWGLNLFPLLLTIVLTLGLHELAHGLAMTAFGATPRYGIKFEALALYATAPGYAFTRNHYLVLIMAPLVGLSLLALIGIIIFAGTRLVPALVVGALINAAGACGDVYMAWLTARYPPTTYVIDEEDGMRVFLPP
jgi:putative zincin peptidase